MQSRILNGYCASLVGVTKLRFACPLLESCTSAANDEAAMLVRSGFGPEPKTVIEIASKVVSLVDSL